MLGHFVGDFLLQFNKIHALKFKNGWGLLLHVLIVIGCLAVFCWPFLDQSGIWLFLVFVGMTHYVQDWAKIKFTSHTKKGLFFFLLDQAFHILFISTLFLTDLKNLRAPWNKSSDVFLNLYNNDFMILYAIALIVASYTAHYIILIFKKDYLKIESVISPFEKRYGFMERIIILSAIIAGNLWLTLIPLTLALRPILFKMLKHKLNVSDRFASSTEIALSVIAGVLTGLTFCLFM